jgi:hypothetical protein
MTLCIAAIANEAKTIVTVSDFMLSNQTSSMEGEITKVSRIGHSKRWLMMYAGDPSNSYLVFRRVNAALAGTKEAEADIIKAFTSAIQQEIKQKIETQLLSPYGWMREDFMRDGRASLGDEQFARLLYAVQNVGLETDFLVAGFSEKDNHHVYSFRDPGVCSVHDQLRFHSIGCGSALADASMMSSFRSDASLTDVIYRLAEAKFKGEAAPGVGKQTFITTLDFDAKTLQVVHPPNVEKIKALWEKNGKPPIPAEAKDLITKTLVKAPD